jgi:serine/threonine-protein kinase HipA
VSETSTVVFKAGIPAATLTSTDGVSHFEYLPDYAGARLPAVATTLPVTSTPITLNGGATPAFFAGLLPEGLRLNALARRIKTSQDNELALLLEVGGDPIGDVQVLALGVQPNTQSDALEIPKDAVGLDFNAIRGEYAGSRASGLAGYQDKVSSRMLNAPAKFRDRDYILKLNPVDAPFVVENEAFFMAKAQECGLGTATYQLLTDANGVNALLLERWDRPVKDGLKKRLAAEDACQVLNLYPASKYDVSFETAASALLDLCPAVGPGALALFKQVVFAWLTGNGDVHTKNLSVLQTTDGEWRISPSYDLVSTIFYDDRTMALTADGLDSGWRRGTLLKVAETLGLPSVVANKVIDQLLGALSALPGEILDGALPFPRHLNVKVSGLLKRRAEALVK